ncbi:Dehydration-responsive protein RD22 [Spatholobus suberectus]|nr:Dehydration-responsive protein RD22 [Spatholobus suberectus]
MLARRPNYIMTPTWHSSSWKRTCLPEQNWTCTSLGVPIKPRSCHAKLQTRYPFHPIRVALKARKSIVSLHLNPWLILALPKLGKNVDEVVSTEVDKETGLQKDTIAPGVKKLAGDKVVGCHKQNYPYAVFYCHKTKTTRAYSVPLEGANGIRVKAVAVCHTHTSEWNPKHLAF